MKGKSKRSTGKNNHVTPNMNFIPAVKTEPKEDMILQFGDCEVPMKDISSKVRQSYKDSGHEDEPKEIKIYIKPEDNRAYYVIDGNIEGSVELVY